MVVATIDGSLDRLAAACHLAAGAGLDELWTVGTFGVTPGRSGTNFLAEASHTAQDTGVTVRLVASAKDDRDELDLALDATDTPFAPVRGRLLVARRGARCRVGGIQVLCRGAGDPDHDTRQARIARYADQGGTPPPAADLILDDGDSAPEPCQLLITPSTAPPPAAAADRTPRQVLTLDPSTRWLATIGLAADHTVTIYDTSRHLRHHSPSGIRN
jgi:hypothetical protein